MKTKGGVTQATHLKLVVTVLLAALAVLVDIELVTPQARKIMVIVIRLCVCLDLEKLHKLHMTWGYSLVLLGLTVHLTLSSIIST